MYEKQIINITLRFWGANNQRRNRWNQLFEAWY